ncbi:MAG: hypothetical protein AB1861_08415 [Cyanobacteriota bacterium]
MAEIPKKRKSTDEEVGLEVESENLPLVEEEITLPQPEVKPQLEPIASVYPSSFYDAAKIPRCSRCGDKKRTGMNGEILCPIRVPDCPQLQG